MTASPPIFDTLAIIGAGLIGSSVAKASRARGLVRHIVLYDRDPAVKARIAELKLGVIADSPEAAVAHADAVILCTPPGSMGEIGTLIGPHVKPGAIITDVGSVKEAIIEQLRPVLPEHCFLVPGHPIAGAERSGPDAGYSTLFEGRWAILTPIDDPRPTYQDAVRKLTDLWESLGARVECMDPIRHDQVLAMTSHLPHLIAFCVVATAQDVEAVTDSEVVKYSAGGFRDFTRIAASDPTMWRDVFLMNKEAVLDLLGRFSEDLTALRRAIRWGDGDTLFSTFERARKMRREVIEAGQDTDVPNFGRDLTTTKSGLQSESH
ncbi:prephenate dehydrogenase [Candidatus Phycosocius bacilliformis]|uniref:prephenate dehydrogenase n=1 Tax=Candidatus Phycosocius bacilliformis TaxID=1445552 RepID=A0A2P2ED67_9PROT|nr:prephenate/arogenate dehydrogenase family protein [Candidatus Phycosocius bacilliformis]GBF58994.1 prephenate dehydrogenase [Candidatus Phycosocius bacilliformis]